MIVPQSQPFPLMKDLLAKTIDCNFFTTLDVNSAFWSIPLYYITVYWGYETGPYYGILGLRDRTKTGFVTQKGHYQWTCLPFGLKTSLTIFQRILGNIMRKYKLTEFAVNYIDNILIFPKTFDEHIRHLEQLIEAIQNEGFLVKFMKFKFAANSVKYLGHVIKDNTITPHRDNLKSIRDFPIPSNRKQIRQF